MARYFLVHKPYGVLSQFTREEEHHRTLADLFDFPPTVYPVGRLDRDSEGLLLLTDDRRLNAALLSPAYRRQKTYWVRVEGTPTSEQITRLRTGVEFRAKKKQYRSAPARVRLLSAAETAGIDPRVPPVRFRKSVPDAWLELIITEGKNRQVRRMCAAVGLPVLRLIRVALSGVELSDLEGTQVREFDASWLLPRLGV